MMRQLTRAAAARRSGAFTGCGDFHIVIGADV